jgi:hypothetical protein
VPLRSRHEWGRRCALLPTRAVAAHNVTASIGHARCTRSLRVSIAILFRLGELSGRSRMIASYALMGLASVDSAA